MSRLWRLPSLNGRSVSSHWRKLLPALAIGAAISAGVVALLVFSENDAPPAVQQRDGLSEIAANSPGEGGIGGGPRWVWPPKRVTEGDWAPPGASVTITEDRPLPAAQHVGGVINGIRMVDPNAPAEVTEHVCYARRADLPFPLETTYLPPNAYLMIEPEVLACPDDGQMTAASVRYQIGAPGALASFGIGFFALSEPWAYVVGEVQPVEINGMKGITVAPERYQGVEVGLGSVVVKTSRRMVEISGARMPLDELIKIAQGVKCLVC